MLFYSVLTITKKELCRAEVPSKILTNLLKQKQDIIKLNKLNKHL